MKKRFEELTFSDNFMFSVILEDPNNLDIAKKIIELSLNRKVKHLRVKSTEKKIQNNYQRKSSVLDVLLEGSDEYIDVEMQLAYLNSFPLRSRMYHSNMDVKMIKEGTNYKDFKENIVIFICKQDYFKMGYPRYTFHTYCDENKELKLEEKRTTIFLNPKSECKEPRLKSFLQFIDNNTVTDGFSKRLQESVEKAKEDEEVKKNYMLMEDYVREVYAEEFEEAEKKAKEQGMKKGMAEGLEKGMAKGLEKGLEKGMAKGIEQGIEQGVEKGKVEIAKQMLLDHEPLNKISKYTGLSKEDILNL